MASLQACHSHSHHLQNHSDDSSSVALMSWPGLSGDQPPSKSPQRVTLEQKSFLLPRKFQGIQELEVRHFHHSGSYNSLRSAVSGTRAETDIYIYCHSTFIHTGLTYSEKKTTGLHYLWSSEYTGPAQSYLFAHFNYPPVVLYFLFSSLPKSCPGFLPRWHLRLSLDFCLLHLHLYLLILVVAWERLPLSGFSLTELYSFY